MGNPNVVISKILETNLPTTLSDGNIVYTDKGNCYISDKTGIVKKITDVMTGYINLTDLQTKNPAITNKIYITNDNELFYYRTSDTSYQPLGGSGTSTTFSGDLSGDSTSQKVVGIQGNIIEDVSYGIGDLLGIKANGKFGKITPATAIGMTGITMIGDNVSILSGEEKTFTHTNSTNVVPYVIERIDGISVTDIHVDFSDSSKYVLQDNKTTELSNNKVQLTSTYWNPLDKGTNVILSNNNLTAKLKGTSTNDFSVRSNKYLTSGKYYWEVKIDGYVSGIPTMIGVANDIFNVNLDSIFNTNQLSYYGSVDSVCSIYPSGTSYGQTFTSNDVIGIAIDIDNKTIKFSKNGTWFSDITLPSWTKYYPFLTFGTSTSLEATVTANFGTLPFVYPIPTDYLPVGYKIVIDTPTYLKTTGLSNFSLSTTDTITSVTIPTTIPTNTSIKCLFSVDNFTNYLYYDGSSIQKFTGTLTSDWGSTSSSYTQLQTLFTNLTVANLTTMLNTLGIIPMNLDFAFQLNTTDTTVTPTISTITMVYTTLAHEEYADIGKYDSVVADYGVKRINNSTLAVKNLKTVEKTIKLLVVTDGSGSGDLNINTLPTF